MDEFRKMKKIYIKSILSLAICLASLLTATYAWLSSSAHMGDINLEILQIDSRIRVYVAKDINYNGIPDLLVTGAHDPDTFYNPNYQDDGETEIGYVTYTNMYYHEKYDFMLHDDKFAISADTELNELLDITMEDAVPGKVYTFKYEITNYSELENGLDLSFDKKDITDDEKAILDTLQIRIAYIDSDGKLILKEYQSFEVFSSSNGMLLTDSRDDIPDTIPAHSVEVDTEKELYGRYDFWLQIKIDDNSTLQFDSITLPEFRIRLSAEQL